MKKKMLLLVLLCSWKFAQSKEYSFDKFFLPESNNIDLTFLESNSYPPGRYYVSIYLNGEYVSKDYFDFGEKMGEKICISYSMLQKLGVNTAKNDNECAVSEDDLNLQTQFDFYAKRLDVFVSPKYLSKKKKGIAPIQSWDEGENAFFASYYFSDDYYSFGGGGSKHAQYANIQPRLNIGPWRIRTQALWNRNDNGESKWDNNYLYADRGLSNIKSRLFIGDAYFPLKNFNNFKFKGVVLKTDENMYPYSERSYAPIIKGGAKTQSKVEIYQDGLMIYSTVVPAGEFNISDYILSGSNNDLYVKVIEDNGSTQYILVPFTVPAIAVREDFTYYEAAIGEISESKNNFAQLSLVHGLPYDFTIFSSTEYSDFYKSIEFGVGKMLGELGALSISSEQSLFKNNNLESAKNKSWEVRYNKNITETDTYFSFSASGQDKHGVSSLRDAINYNNSTYHSSVKNEYSASISQSFGIYGSLSLNGAWRNYWASNEKTDSYSLTYTAPIFNNKAFLTGSFIKNDMVTTNGGRVQDTIFNIGINIPLNLFSNNQSLSYNVASEKNRSDYHQLGISGSGYENKISWNINQSYTTANDRTTTSLYGSYKAKYAKINAGYSRSEIYNHTHGGIEGSMVLYNDGLIFGQQVGDTISIIEAKGAENTKIRGWGGVETDRHGKALTGHIVPYQYNIISLDPTTLPLDASLDVTTTSVVPTSGAIVKASYNVKKGKKIVLTLNKSNGDEIPFGAIVTMRDNNQNTAIVGERGQVYLDASQDRGSLEVVWGREENKKCIVDYKVVSDKNIAGVYKGVAGACM
ncbi:fimbria/pilus outer membrane usher protein [Kosakonia sp. MUSA4]|uniref:fimbria/pilus outer membrane usher protein n=1 Tax=Kosakonia sp. MUSA4 TaxID=2067958 RepID=UPI00159A9EF1|nr:fimbria/pilus outer membrane usher protein [Kosakonia sp. MUSA4]QJT78899.1 fimbrial biogenesis outer membrane usher protein [Kosakonia sp. MUSA4]